MNSNTNKTPDQRLAQPVVVSSDWFGWFHRGHASEPDHVISLCAGHRYLVTKTSDNGSYLATKSQWHFGPGDMPDLPPADGCCVCMGTVTINRMKGAPLSLPNTSVTNSHTEKL